MIPNNGKSAVNIVVVSLELQLFNDVFDLSFSLLFIRIYLIQSILAVPSNIGILLSLTFHRALESVYSNMDT
jgi:hypothetical protein